MSRRMIAALFLASAGLLVRSAVAQDLGSASVVKRAPGQPLHGAVRANPESGGSSVTYLRIGANEFQPLSTSMTYTSAFGAFRIYSLTNNGDLFATVHLPGGALLKSIELDDCDTNADWHLILYLSNCDFVGNCNPIVLAALSSADNLPSPCGFVTTDLSPLNFTVDNFGHELILNAHFTAGDDTNQLAGAIIGYQLQVSPDPVTATFSDVPVGHPFHRFVEALVASGITGGYPDGRFGVNDPVTRGQMAVFLSVALGLEFP